MTSNKKICFATIVGRPNVGKSSLLNSILGYNLSIVTSTAQTTRDQITGVFTEGDYQIIFTDTPGIHKPKHLLGEHLNESAYESLKGIDLVLFLSPADEKLGPGDKTILDKIQNIKNKIAVITKIDKIKGKVELLTEKIEELTPFDFKHIISTSVENEKSIDDLINLITEFAYTGEFQYDEDEITDKNLRFLAKEFIRESAIENLEDELPHSIAVEIISFEENEDKNIIEANIYVKKDSQKGMVIGKNGAKIKKISMSARHKMTQAFDKNTNLFLKVKVSKNWVKDEKMLKKLDY